MSFAPFPNESPLRVHDQAMVTWLSGLHVDYGTINGADRTDFPILTVLATPDRTFAEVADLLVTSGWVGGSTDSVRRVNANALEVLPTPFVSVWRGDPVLDMAHTRVVPTMQFWDRDNQTVNSYYHPRYYDVPYTLSFFSQKTYTDNYLREWLMGQFSVIGCSANERLIPVVHANPFGTTKQCLRFRGTSDRSNLEGNQPRYKRFDANLELRMLYLSGEVRSTHPAV